MKEDLLKDVLREGNFSEFRSRIETQVLAEARRKRWRRNMKGLAIAAALTLLASLAWLPEPEPKQAVRVAERRGVVDVVRTRAMGDFVVRTKPVIHVIDDGELLEMFENRPTALVAVNGQKKLIFLEADDARRFMGSD